MVKWVKKFYGEEESAKFIRFRGLPASLQLIDSLPTTEPARRLPRPMDHGPRVRSLRFPSPTVDYLRSFQVVGAVDMWRSADLSRNRLPVVSA